jgi:hypothetical protein
MAAQYASRQRQLWRTTQAEGLWSLTPDLARLGRASGWLDRAMVIPSMRTTGRAVSHGRLRKCLVRTGLSGAAPGRSGCCTFVLHVASSSRSQVRRLSCWAHPVADLVGTVRQRPPESVLESSDCQLVHPACSRAWRSVSSARSAYSAACRLCFEPLPAPIAPKLIAMPTKGEFKTMQ